MAYSVCHKTFLRGYFEILVILLLSRALLRAEWLWFALCIVLTCSTWQSALPGCLAWFIFVIMLVAF